jgi:hypothetical protein
MSSPAKHVPIPELDVVPLTQLQADMKELVARQQADALRGPGLDVWMQMACARPDACSCDDDYPGWTPGGAR